MIDFVYIKNNENGSEAILSHKDFKKLKYMFSDNSTYKYLTEEQMLEMRHNAN